MRTLALLLATLLAIAACTDAGRLGPSSEPTNPTAPSSSAGPVLAPNATVERVVDGDTLVADIGGRRERVRLIGIDTPESVAENRPDQCYGAEAAAYLTELLPAGTPITLVLDEEERDQYDRLLAYVLRSDDQLFVNLDLVEKGFADTLFFPPNTHYAARFSDAVRAAQRADIGLWGACGGPDVPLE